MNTEQQIFYHLSVALAIGLLVGVERGWEGREAREGQRVAGVRTYGLIGLLGGCSALLAAPLGAITIGLIFAGLAGTLTVAYLTNLHTERDVGITSLIAALLVYVLGLLAGLGQVAEAVAAAVVTALLLQYKPVLHRWVNALEGSELRAGIKLLLISAVVLPLLPHQGYGPWQALNPYEMWWMVVLVAAISFVGYFALKLGGARKGAVFTGLFSGLVSSTALTLHFSRLTRREPLVAPTMATGILLACGTMLPRMLLVASLINPQLLPLLLIPAGIMATLVYVPALFYWWTLAVRHDDPPVPLQNPLELKTAISFGILLAVIMLLGKALQEWVGAAGVLLLATASGVADVDAITLSLSRLSLGNLGLPTAALGIVLAAAVNSLVKAGIASLVGGKAMGLRVGIPLLSSAAGGVSAAWWLLP
jgi:uncharacterized membrane protein (DUF4010 family)